MPITQSSARDTTDGCHLKRIVEKEGDDQISKLEYCARPYSKSSPREQCTANGDTLIPYRRTEENEVESLHEAKVTIKLNRNELLGTSLAHPNHGDQGSPKAAIGETYLQRKSSLEASCGRHTGTDGGEHVWTMQNIDPTSNDSSSLERE